MADRPVKRFVVPVTGSGVGLDMSGNRPSYFVHHHYKQYHQQPRQPNNNNKQQQQQQQQHQQQQHQQQNQPHHQNQHSYQYRVPVVDQYNFGLSAGGTGGHDGEHPSDGYYQQGGGDGAFNMDTNGFTDFAPSAGPSSPFSVSPPSPVGPSEFQSSLFNGNEHGGGTTGGHVFDTADFGKESPSAGYTTGRDAAASSGYDYKPQQAPVIHKSVYVHVAPPDDEPPRKQRVILPDVPPKKNYQIVFIKAPTAPPLLAPIIPPPPQHSDKTLIYVLHPKQEEAPPIHIPAPPVTQPLKPEVYFIKYKKREESNGGALPSPGDEFGHGGGVSPSSPGEEFGGGDVSGGYPHRRYGRGDRTHESNDGSPSTDDLHDEDENGATSLEQRERVTDDDDDDGGDRHHDAETLTATVDPRTTTMTTDTTVDRSLRGGYSAELDDASGDSSNRNEMHVQPSVITTPKGKNGH